MKANVTTVTASQIKYIFQNCIIQIFYLFCICGETGLTTSEHFTPTITDKGNMRNSTTRSKSQLID